MFVDVLYIITILKKHLHVLWFDCWLVGWFLDILFTVGLSYAKVTLRIKVSIYIE